jgi:two-component system sensor histidine kinase FlrB
LLNLATNAMQACGTGVELILEVNSVTADAIEIQIKDNGPGIDSEIQDKIFEPFFTTRSGGTGLGLAVVRAVIQGHRGEIQVRSKLDQGTAFILTLPCRLGEHALASGLWCGSPARDHLPSDKTVTINDY